MNGTCPNLVSISSWSIDRISFSSITETVSQCNNIHDSPQLLPKFPLIKPKQLNCVFRSIICSAKSTVFCTGCKSIETTRNSTNSSPNYTKMTAINTEPKSASPPRLSKLIFHSPVNSSPSPYLVHFAQCITVKMAATQKKEKPITPQKSGLLEFSKTNLPSPKKNLRPSNTIPHVSDPTLILPAEHTCYFFFCVTLPHIPRAPPGHATPRICTHKRAHRLQRLNLHRLLFSPFP